MPSFRRDLPAIGLAQVDIELWRGSLTVRTAAPDEAGSMESGWELQAGIDGDTLHVRQPGDIGHPLGLADLIGEQQSGSR